MSASVKTTDCFSASGSPNVKRSCTYCTARSSAHWAPPSEQAAMLMRPPLRADIAILKPWPSTPRIAEAGTRTSSRITWRVGCAFQPIFFSF